MLQWPSFPIVINTVSSYSVDSSSSVLLMKGSIPARERSGLTLLSKPFRAHWFDSLLVRLTISWQSLKCKRRHTHSKYKSLFEAESGEDLHCICTVVFAVVMVMTHPLHLARCLCHWCWRKSQFTVGLWLQLFRKNSRFKSIFGGGTEWNTYLTQLR